MRLYPPAWAIGRRAIEDVEIGGYTIPNAGRSCSSHSTSCTATRGSSPTRIGSIPIAGCPSGRKARPKFAYFPFGGGTRVCIGESFAWMEGSWFWRRWPRRWRMESLETEVVPLQPVLTLRPARGIRMRAMARCAELD